MFIIRNKNIFIGISAFMVVVSIVLLSVFSLKFGIDFQGGALTEVSYPDGRPDVLIVEKQVDSLKYGEVTIQPAGDTGYIIKSKDLTNEEKQALLSVLSQNGVAVEEKAFNSIGPSVGRELKTKSIYAIIAVIVGTILFIAYAFRGVSKPVSSWRYGFITIASLLHDIMIPTGVFAILSHYYGAEVDTLFVVALLTVLGISVADTIVVFDRIRENLKNHSASTFAETVGKSLSETFARSINTSLTVIFVLLSLFLFGPEQTKNFSLILMIGLIFGTYSSIFLASPLLVLTEELQTKK